MTLIYDLDLDILKMHLQTKMYFVGQDRQELEHKFSFHFISRVVAVDSSHMAASSSALWSSFSPPSNFVCGHMSTMWFMVCRWPQSQEGDWTRPNLCRFAWHGPWPVWKWLSRDHVWRGRSKPGCRRVGLVTLECLTRQHDWDRQTSTDRCDWSN